MNDANDGFYLDESLYPGPGPGEKKRYLLRKDEKSELVLMIWGAGAISPIHDHGGSECLTVLLQGQLVEKTFHRESLIVLSEENLRIHKQNYVDKDEGVHQLLNLTDSAVYTLHEYRKPLTHCNVYDVESRSWTVWESYYDNLVEVRA